MINYDRLPIKTFFQILQNEEENLYLLGDVENVEDLWVSIKEEFQERHPSADSRRLVDAQKKVIRESAELNKIIVLFHIVMNNEPGADLSNSYSIAKIKYIENHSDRLKDLETRVVKIETKLQIFQAKLEKIEKEIEETKESNISLDTTMSELNEAIATLELNGYTIDNYDTLTCGKYDAISKVTKEKK